jgi:copper chaperone
MIERTRLMESVQLKIGGMSCSGCVSSVMRTLKAVPGVEDVAVTLEPGVAQVRFDPRQTSVPVLRAAVEEAGYDVVG